MACTFSIGEPRFERGASDQSAAAYLNSWWPGAICDQAMQCSAADPEISGSFIQAENFVFLLDSFDPHRSDPRRLAPISPFPSVLTLFVVFG